jgi:hypothetical protein
MFRTCYCLRIHCVLVTLAHAYRMDAHPGQRDGRWAVVNVFLLQQVEQRPL